MNFELRNIFDMVVVTYIGYRLYYGFSLKGMFRRFNRIPFIRRRIDAEVDKKLGKVKPGLIEDRFKHIELPSDPTIMQRRVVLAGEPMDDDEIMKRIDRICTCNRADYKISGAIYADESRFSDMVGAIYAKTAWLNPTHSSVWPELTQLEAEIYAMICDIFSLQTGENPAIMTPGGTMSNIQAIYTYRNLMEVERNITSPNIVAPVTAHTSFKKACQILKIDYRTCDVDDAGRADIQSMRRLVDSNTICIVGSAPSFPYGIIDPIGEISKLAQSKKVPFHVDCCLGGFMVPFTKDLSEICDFRDPGITSISADPHKFGQSPKGISILMFRSEAVKQYLTFVDLNWAGGLYVMPDFFGSRAGSNVAILWAILNKMGRDEYSRITTELIDMRKSLTDQIEQTFGRNSGDIIYVLGDPELSTFGIKSDKYSIHFVNKMMGKYGWEFNSLPDGMHFCLTNKHLIDAEKFIPEFIGDLEKATAYIDEHPDEDPGDTAQIYCSAQEIPGFAEDILDKIGRTYIQIQGMVSPDDPNVDKDK
jgi:sphinganine-1-phosphate aldolase